MSREVTISGTTIGDDSKSGLAFLITTKDGEDNWIPYSVCSGRTISGHRGGDSITVAAWFAEKEELE